MKKSLILVTIILFVCTFTASVSAEQLEKIAHPNDIPDYQNIKQIDNALWGIKNQIEHLEKKLQSLQDATELPPVEPFQPGNENGPVGPPMGPNFIAPNLEMIPHPNYIPFFNQISQVGNALWGVKIDNQINQPPNGQPGEFIPPNSEPFNPNQQNPAPFDPALGGQPVNPQPNGQPIGPPQPMPGQPGEFQAIPHPNEIPYYDEVRQVGNALWGYKVVRTIEVMDAEQTTCVKGAVVARNNGLEKIVENQKEKLLNLISTRNSCELNALDISDGKEKMDTLIRCHKDFEQKVMELNHEEHKNRNDNSRIYDETTKGCFHDGIEEQSVLLEIKDDELDL